MHRVGLSNAEYIEDLIEKFKPEHSFSAEIFDI